MKHGREEEEEEEEEKNHKENERGIDGKYIMNGR